VSVTLTVHGLLLLKWTERIATSLKCHHLLVLVLVPRFGIMQDAKRTVLKVPSYAFRQMTLMQFLLCRVLLSSEAGPDSYNALTSA